MTEHIGPAREAGTFVVTVRHAAKLLEHPSRSRIVVEPACAELRSAELIKGESNQPACRLGGVALAPIGLAQPIAEFPAAGGMDPADADMSGRRFAQNRERQIL